MLELGSRFDAWLTCYDIDSRAVKGGSTPEIVSAASDLCLAVHLGKTFDAWNWIQRKTACAMPLQVYPWTLSLLRCQRHRHYESHVQGYIIHATWLDSLSSCSETPAKGRNDEECAMWETWFVATTILKFIDANRVKSLLTMRHSDAWMDDACPITIPAKNRALLCHVATLSKDVFHVCVLSVVVFEETLQNYCR